MNNTPAITTKSLSKKYAGTNFYALEDLNITINYGEVYGLLGPNGAGKSTAIKLLMNFIQPSSGSATIAGLDAVKDSVMLKNNVGYLSGDVAMYRKMTGRQFISYMHDLQPAISKKYTISLEKRLKADMTKKIGDLSKGNRQKLGLLQAFMHQPDILILDEPTSGLDPLIQEVFHELILESKQRGAAVLISSHILSEVQKTCDRVGIIRAGKLVTQKNIDEMLVEAAQTFDITFAAKPPLQLLKKLPGTKVVSQKQNDVTVHVHGGLSGLFAILAKHEVLKIDAKNLDLEDVFMRFYEDKAVKK